MWHSTLYYYELALVIITIPNCLQYKIIFTLIYILLDDLIFNTNLILHLTLPNALLNITLEV